MFLILAGEIRVRRCRAVARGALPGLRFPTLVGNMENVDFPGWDSLESVTRLHSFFEMAGIVCLALLVVAEVLAFKYGNRKDVLTGAREEATAKELRVLKEREAPRSLSEAQRIKLLDELSKGKTYELTVRHSSDLESQNFAEQISTALRAAGWKINPPAFRIVTRDAAGLFIVVRDMNSPPAGGSVCPRGA